MNSTEGVNWVISWTPNFEQTVTFFRDVLGLPITAEGVPVTATQFARYAPFTLLIGGVLESVEPTADVRQRYTAPIVSFTVDDVAQARQQLGATAGDGHTFAPQMAMGTNFRVGMRAVRDAPMTAPGCGHLLQLAEIHPVMVTDETVYE